MSLISMLGSSDQQMLAFALQTAINSAITKGTSEPDVVARLTYLIPKNVNGLKLRAAVNIKVGSVFIHQTPKVKFSGMVAQKYIEIGDLLLINKYINGSKITRKAMLYQAKIFKKLPVKPDNINQHELYQNWPDFEYVNSTALLNGQKRSVKGLDLHSSAKYLLLRYNKPLSSTPFHILHSKFRSGNALTAHATNPLSAHECFIKESYHFVLGDYGKEFNLLPDSDPDIGWSRVINDLINVTAKKVVSTMTSASGGTNPSRGCFLYGEGLSFVETKNMIDEEPPYEVPPRHIDDDSGDGEGISIIEIVIESVNVEENSK